MDSDNFDFNLDDYFDSMAWKFKKLTPTAKLPTRATPHSAGYDVYADGPLTLQPGQYGLVSTGLAMALPEATEVQIRPRSGLAAKYGVTVLNSPGTIDEDYRGEVKVILINHGTGVFHVQPGDRIAQMVLGFVVDACLQEVDVLPDTKRGTGGFGSTGA